LRSGSSSRKTPNTRAFDLGKEIDKATDDVAKAVTAAQLPGLKIAAGPAKLSLDSVFVTEPALIAVVKMSMPLNAEVTAEIVK
jgi:hypothetical protein